MREHNETPDQNTAKQAATDATVLSNDDSPPSTDKQPVGARHTRGENISYNHLYNPDAIDISAFNNTNFIADDSIKYDFEYLSEGAIEGFVLGLTAQMSMKREIKEFGDSRVDVVHKEMKNINDIGVPIPVDPCKLSSKTKAAAL